MGQFHKNTGASSNHNIAHTDNTLAHYAVLGYVCSFKSEESWRVLNIYVPETAGWTSLAVTFFKFTMALAASYTTIFFWKGGRGEGEEHVNYIVKWQSTVVSCR